MKLAKDKENTIYVAGPMTGYEDFNFPAFNSAEERLKSLGYTVMNPASHGVVDGATWADYLAADIKQLVECGHIYLLEGWEYSKGAQLEFHIATKLGLKVHFE